MTYEERASVELKRANESTPDWATYHIGRAIVLALLAIAAAIPSGGNR